jgi:hypothetical protein
MLLPFDKELSVLPPLFLLGGLIAFFLGFWSANNLAKKSLEECQHLTKITVE